MNPNDMICHRLSDGSLHCTPHMSLADEGAGIIMGVVLLLAAILLMAAGQAIWRSRWVYQLRQARTERQKEWLKHESERRALPEMYAVGDRVELQHSLRPKVAPRVPVESQVLGDAVRSMTATSSRPMIYEGSILEVAVEDRIIGRKRYTAPAGYTVSWDDGRTTYEAPERLRRRF